MHDDIFLLVEELDRHCLFLCFFCHYYLCKSGKGEHDSQIRQIGKPRHELIHNLMFCLLIIEF